MHYLPEAKDARGFMTEVWQKPDRRDRILRMKRKYESLDFRL